MSSINFTDISNPSSLAKQQNFLMRPHLHELLEKAVQKPVTTVIAGAGYGKTQTVYSFLQEYNVPTLWLSMSLFDNLETRLWEHIIYTVTFRNQVFADELTALGFPETIQEFSRLVFLLGSHMHPNRKYILVFDDFYLLHEKKVLNFFDMLINANIPNLHMIFISRIELQINMVRLLSKGLLTSIGEDELRFTPKEMVHYLQLVGVQMSMTSMLDSYKYTDGWIFAIQLLGLAFKKGAASESLAISAVKRNIHQLMESEVFSLYSPEMQIFLIKLSLLENAPLELLYELFPDHQSLVEQLAQSSNFIRYDGFLNTFRIHHLFLHYLKVKQTFLSQSDIDNILSKAATWCWDHGYKIDALHYWEKTHHYDKIVETLAGFYAYSTPETAQFSLGIINRIPPDSPIAQKSIVELYYCRFLMNAFLLEDFYIRSEALKNKLESLPPTPEQQSILGEIYLLLGLIAMLEGLAGVTQKFRNYFAKAYACLPQGSAYFSRETNLNQGHFLCAVGQPKAGEFARFCQELSDSIVDLSPLMHGSAYGMDKACLTEWHYFQNDMKAAEKYAYQAIYQSQEKGQFDVEVFALFYLVKIEVAAGNYNKILDLLHQLRQLAEKHNTSFCYRMLDNTESWLYTQLGQTSKVAAWIVNDAENIKITAPISFGFDRLIRAHCLLVDQKYHELLASLQQHQDYGADSYLAGAVEYKILIAIAHYNLKDTSGALEALEEAYRLAEANSLDMIFIEQGNHMRTLIRAAKQSSTCQIPPQWLQIIYSKSTTYAKRLAYLSAQFNHSDSNAQSLHLKLTKREQEVLVDLSHGLTREEIAEHLALSVNTVRPLMQNIFTKLNVSNTIEAVHVATRLKIID